MKKAFFHLLRFVIQTALFLLEGIVSLVERVQYWILRLVFKPEFVRRGSCARTGQCCQAIGIELPGAWFRYPRLIALIQIWHHLRYNFTARGRQDNLLVYSCNYLTQDKLCGIQRFKPKLCRDFPQSSLRGFTKLHKGCGYYFEKRVGPDFGKILKNKVDADQKA